MQTRRHFIQSVPALGAGILLTDTGVDSAQAQSSPSAHGENSWHSPSLITETATGPGGAITTRAAIDVNKGLGANEKIADEVIKGVYHLRGWGIAHSIAIDAPDGWIIVDTGDSTRVASEQRALLERTVGKEIKVAAILLTHWHYGDGTAAWMDKGTEIWGHEHLDANRSAAAGVSVTRGFYLSRAFAQFGVLHPPEGPDAFPNLLGFTLEKFLAESSYRPPTRLFRNGEIMNLTIAGEPVEVAPNRSDTTCSVGFYFPGRRTLVTNFMVMPTIFNIYTLRGGRFRDPAVFVNDARWLESKNAEVILDIHAPPVSGRDAVRAAIERSVDQVQIIHDQTLRLIARGMDAREAAEAVHMPAHQRDGMELYGQVESHVRQVYNGTVGWFGHDVYDINPLSLREEAARSIDMMGGPGAVRKAAADAAKTGGLANWRWCLRLTSMLLRLDPQDAEARAARAAAARALGQRTTSANARGFYITEALQIEGGMRFKGRPVTLDLVRGFLGTPSLEQLSEAPPAQVLEFLRYMIDPRRAERKRLAFTMTVGSDRRLWRVQLRNGVLVISNPEAKESTHLDVTPAELAEFVLGLRTLGAAGSVVGELDSALDRSHFYLNHLSEQPEFIQAHDLAKSTVDGGCEH